MTARPPRIDRNAYGEAIFVRPRNPADHREFDFLLPQCTVLFVYADERGRDWVRWSLPQAVATELGWGDGKCDCCEQTNEPGVDGAMHFDTALDETDWFFDDNPLFRK